MNKIAFYTTIIAGILLVASFFPHAFQGTTVLNEMIRNGHITGNDTIVLRLGWILGSITILLLGVWCFFLAPSIRKGVFRAKAQIFILGLGLSAFGLGAILIENKISSYLLFGFEGLLLLLPSLFIKNESV